MALHVDGAARFAFDALPGVEAILAHLTSTPANLASTTTSTRPADASTRHHRHHQAMSGDVAMMANAAAVHPRQAELDAAIATLTTAVNTWRTVQQSRRTDAASAQKSSHTSKQSNDDGVTPVHIVKDVLNALVALLLLPSCTLLIAQHFRPVLVDLVERAAASTRTFMMMMMPSAAADALAGSGARRLSPWSRHEQTGIAFSQLLMLQPSLLPAVLDYYRTAPSYFVRLLHAGSSPSDAEQNENDAAAAAADLCALLAAAHRFLRFDASAFRNLWDWSPVFGLLTSRHPETLFHATCINALIASHDDLALAFPSDDLGTQLLLQTHLHDAELCAIDQAAVNTAASAVAHSSSSSSSSSSTSAPLQLLVTGAHLSSSLVDICSIILRRNSPAESEDLPSARLLDTTTTTDPASHSSSANTTLVATRTTARNLRTVALAVSQRVPVLLEGPIGCGKTAVITRLAELTGRTRECDLIRIHLGDQADSKTLLGTYMCTETPGEFRWQPGALAQAVEQGRWLVIEDINLAPLDVLSVLIPLLEKRQLFIPGRGEVLAAAPGFQLFATRTTATPSATTAVSADPATDDHDDDTLLASSSGRTSTAMGDALWSKVRCLPLGTEELRSVLSIKFPALQYILDTLMDVYVTMVVRPASSSSASAAGVTALPSSSSSRPLSLRDLMKWCTRLSALQARKSEAQLTLSREEIFSEAVDCFCLMTANPDRRLALLRAVGTAIGLSKESVKYYVESFKPAVQQTAAVFSVGRALLPVLPPVPGAQQTFYATSRFAFTRHALKLLESIASCVSANEPVLLSGETGTGKTSVVQFLSEQLGQRLSVLNMSQQSDSSDLLGGFKPVDVHVLCAPLKEQFDLIFPQTFSRKANAKFIAKVSAVFAAKDWDKLLSLLSSAVQMAQAKMDKENGDRESGTSDIALPARIFTPQLRTQWTAFTHAVTKFEKQREQLRQGSFAFDFVEGTLAEAVRSGQWVLLDEINLANPETLECLNGLLDGEHGSLTLTERGDLEPIPRHPNFRLFACMNPATDVGKRDLPPGFRNRFTELYVDDVTDKEDLTTVVGSYLKSIPSISPKLIDDTVAFYLSVRRETAATLADGSAQRPHFSLRTLCRALEHAKSVLPIYGLQRSLYEGFCMSFLTQLGRTSFLAVHALIERAFVTGALGAGQAASGLPSSYSSATASTTAVAAFTRVPAEPTPLGSHVLVEGFWVERGTEPLPTGPLPYIITPSIRDNLRCLARIATTRRHPVLIQGPTSSGKTSMVEYLAMLTGHRFVRINNHEHTDLQEYLGSYVSDENGQLRFHEGVLVEAVRKGYWIVLDELNLAPSDVLEALNRLLDDNRELYLTETQETVRPHPHFMLFATQNPPGLYGGRKALSRAFRNRFVELHFDDIPDTELETILSSRCAIPPSYCTKLVAILRDLQKQRQGTNVFAGKQGFITLRDLFRWANRHPNGYQQLAEDGYMILAERVRKQDEKELVKTVLQRHLNVTIDLERLYSCAAPRSHHNTTTKRGNASAFVSEDDLYGSALFHDMIARLQAESTTDADAADDPLLEFRALVWTRAMRRLFVLVERCLRNKEPILLVGDTGTGKTTILQVFAGILRSRLHIVNCHQHTETSDFIGSLRPVRGKEQVTATLHQLLAAYYATSAAAAGASADAVTQPPASCAELVQWFETLQVPSDTAEVQSIMQLIPEYRALFAWSDGPLVTAMRSGDMFLLDEISLADDSVLERLNSVLEPGRLLVLAEKVGGNNSSDRTTGGNEQGTAASDLDVEELVAHDGFRIAATMNPGGDFGKKELSPALRNRFTEIWVPHVNDREDLSNILQSSLLTLPDALHQAQSELQIWAGAFAQQEHLEGAVRSHLEQAIAALHSLGLPTLMLDFVDWFRSQHNRSVVSLRDLLSWVRFINTMTVRHVVQSLNGASAMLTEASERAVAFQFFVHGASMVFIDAIGTGAIATPNSSAAKDAAVRFLLSQAPANLGPSAAQSAATRMILNVGDGNSSSLVDDEPASQQAPAATTTFGVDPFYIPLAGEPQKANFTVHAATTRRNLIRVLRALQLSRPVLLEGSPGVGKTSLIVALAALSGNAVERINLSEQTDVMDLFGSDLPVEDGAGGEFAWRDGVFLQAMKQGKWVLLDELNLASQAVLEGLNACLDHRATVYIPELDRSFACAPSFRVFACQNPLQQGGGRKGLPKSFLNRFTQVYVEPLTDADLEFIAMRFHEAIPSSVLKKMIEFNSRLHHETMVARSFGRLGAPWEFNLRDVFRWCELMLAHQADGAWNPAVFFDVMYLQRFRSQDDRVKATELFCAVFAQPLAASSSTLDATTAESEASGHPVDWAAITTAAANALTMNPELQLWPDSITLGHVALERVSIATDEATPTTVSALAAANHAARPVDRTLEHFPLPLTGFLRPLSALMTCVKHGWMSIVCGGASVGKSSCIRWLAAATGHPLHQFSMNSSVDTMELLGGFEQVDIAPQRQHLVDAIAQTVQVAMQRLVLFQASVPETDVVGLEALASTLQRISGAWDSCITRLAALRAQQQQANTANEAANSSAPSEPLYEALSACLNLIEAAMMEFGCAPIPLAEVRQTLATVRTLEQANLSGRFEWIDGLLVQALRNGHWVVIDNVNFCNPSVLDRLNPLLETNGVLVVSERGCNDNNDAGAEVIRPHPNFRLFLTMDPKHGEISRAMRNRGVEIVLLDEALSSADAAAMMASVGLHLGVQLEEALVSFHRALLHFDQPANDLNNGGAGSLPASKALVDTLRGAVSPLALPTVARRVHHALSIGLSDVRELLSAVVDDVYGRAVAAIPGQLARYRQLKQRLLGGSGLVGASVCSGLSATTLSPTMSGQGRLAHSSLTGAAVDGAHAFVDLHRRLAALLLLAIQSSTKPLDQTIRQIHALLHTFTPAQRTRVLSLLPSERMTMNQAAASIAAALSSDDAEFFVTFHARLLALLEGISPSARRARMLWLGVLRETIELVSNVCSILQLYHARLASWCEQTVAAIDAAVGAATLVLNHPICQGFWAFRDSLAAQLAPLVASTAWGGNTMLLLAASHAALVPTRSPSVPLAIAARRMTRSDLPAEQPSEADKQAVLFDEACRQLLQVYLRYCWDATVDKHRTSSTVASSNDGFDGISLLEQSRRLLQGYDAGQGRYTGAVTYTALQLVAPFLDTVEQYLTEMFQSFGTALAVGQTSLPAQALLDLRQVAGLLESRLRPCMYHLRRSLSQFPHPDISTLLLEWRWLQKCLRQLIQFPLHESLQSFRESAQTEAKLQLLLDKLGAALQLSDTQSPISALWKRGGHPAAFRSKRAAHVSAEVGRLSSELAVPLVSSHDSLVTGSQKSLRSSHGSSALLEASESFSRLVEVSGWVGDLSALQVTPLAAGAEQRSMLAEAGATVAHVSAMYQANDHSRSELLLASVERLVANVQAQQKGRSAVAAAVSNVESSGMAMESSAEDEQADSAAVSDEDHQRLLRDLVAKVDLWPLCDHRALVLEQQAIQAAQVASVMCRATNIDMDLVEHKCRHSLELLEKFKDYSLRMTPRAPADVATVQVLLWQNATLAAIPNPSKPRSHDQRRALLDAFASSFEAARDALLVSHHARLVANTSNDLSFIDFRSIVEQLGAETSALQQGNQATLPFATRVENVAKLSTACLASSGSPRLHQSLQTAHVAPMLQSLHGVALQSAPSKIDQLRQLERHLASDADVRVDHLLPETLSLCALLCNTLAPYSVASAEPAHVASALLLLQQITLDTSTAPDVLRAVIEQLTLAQLPVSVSEHFESLLLPLAHALSNALQSAPATLPSDNQHHQTLHEVSNAKASLLLGSLRLALLVPRAPVDPAVKAAVKLEHSRLDMALLTVERQVHSDLELLRTGNSSSPRISDLTSQVELEVRRSDELSQNVVLRPEVPGFASLVAEWQQFASTMLEGARVHAMVGGFEQLATAAATAGGASHHDKKLLVGRLQQLQSQEIAWQSNCTSFVSRSRERYPLYSDVVLPMCAAVFLVTDGVRRLAHVAATAIANVEIETQLVRAWSAFPPQALAIALPSELDPATDDATAPHSILLHEARHTVRRCIALHHLHSAKPEYQQLRLAALSVGLAHLVVHTESARAVDPQTLAFLHELVDEHSRAWRVHRDAAKELAKVESSLYRFASIVIGDGAKRMDEEEREREFRALFPDFGSDFAHMVDSDEFAPIEPSVPVVQNNPAQPTKAPSAEAIRVAQLERDVLPPAALLAVARCHRELFEACTPHSLLNVESDMVAPVHARHDASRIRLFEERYRSLSHVMQMLSHQQNDGGRTDADASSAHVLASAIMRLQLSNSSDQALMRGLSPLDAASSGEYMSDDLLRELVADFSSTDVHKKARGGWTKRAAAASDVFASATYDIYRDPNVIEVQHAIEVLNAFIKRTTDLLRMWPDHPILQHLLAVATRVLSFPITSPLMRILNGLEILFTKAHEWEKVAARHVSLSSQIDRLTQLILRWRQLELKAWPLALRAKERDVQNKVLGAFWLHLYALVATIASASSTSLPQTTVPADSESKADEDDDDDHDNDDSADKASAPIDGFALVRQAQTTLQDLIKASCLGDFAVRVRMLHAFYCHVSTMCSMTFGAADKQRTPLHALRDALLQSFLVYVQFVPSVVDELDKLRRPVVEELDNFTKIARWKDVNYWAVKESAEKSHRALHKFSKRYQDALTTPAASILQAGLSSLSAAREITDAANVVGAHISKVARKLAAKRTRGAAGHAAAAAGDQSLIANELESWVPQQLKTRFAEAVAPVTARIHALEARAALQSTSDDVMMVVVDQAGDAGTNTSGNTDGNLLARIPALSARLSKIASRDIFEIVSRTATRSPGSVIEHIVAVDEFAVEIIARAKEFREWVYVPPPITDKERIKELESKAVKHQRQLKGKALAALLRHLRLVGLSARGAMNAATADTSLESLMAAPAFAQVAMTTLASGDGAVATVGANAGLYSMLRRSDEYFALLVVRADVLRQALLKPEARDIPMDALQRSSGFVEHLLSVIASDKRMLTRVWSERSALHDLLHMFASCAVFQPAEAADNAAPLALDVQRSDRHDALVLMSLLAAAGNMLNQVDNVQLLLRFALPTSLARSPSEMQEIQAALASVRQILVSTLTTLRSCLSAFEPLRQAAIAGASYRQVLLQLPLPGTVSAAVLTGKSLVSAIPALVSRLQHLLVPTQIGQTLENACQSLVQAVTAATTTQLPALAPASHSDLEAQMDELARHALVATQRIKTSVDALHQHARTAQAESASSSTQAAAAPDAEASSTTTHYADEEGEDDHDSPAELEPGHLMHASHHFREALEGVDLALLTTRLVRVASLVASASSAATAENEHAMLEARFLQVVLLVSQLVGVMDGVLTQAVVFHKSLCKLEHVLVNLTLDLTTKGFCTPADNSKEGGEGEGDGDPASGSKFLADGTGIGEGEGQNDVSDQIESEDQVLGTKQDDKRDASKEPLDKKEKDTGLEMDDDFDAELYDMPEGDNDEQQDDDGEQDEQDDTDKLDEQMGDLDQSKADVVDEKMWGEDSDDEDNDPTGGKDDKVERGASMQDGNQESELAAKSDPSSSSKPDKKDQQQKSQKEDKKSQADKKQPQQPSGEDEEDQAGEDHPINEDTEDRYEENHGIQVEKQSKFMEDEDAGAPEEGSEDGEDGSEEEEEDGDDHDDERDADPDAAKRLQEQQYGTEDGQEEGEGGEGQGEGADQEEEGDELPENMNLDGDDEDGGGGGEEPMPTGGLDDDQPDEGADGENPADADAQKQTTGEDATDEQEPAGDDEGERTHQDDLGDADEFADAPQEQDQATDMDVDEPQSNASADRSFNNRNSSDQGSTATSSMTQPDANHGNDQRNQQKQQKQQRGTRSSQPSATQSKSAGGSDDKRGEDAEQEEEDPSASTSKKQPQSESSDMAQDDVEEDGQQPEKSSSSSSAQQDASADGEWQRHQAEQTRQQQQYKKRNEVNPNRQLGDLLKAWKDRLKLLKQQDADVDDAAADSMDLHDDDAETEAEDQTAGDDGEPDDSDAQLAGEAYEFVGKNERASSRDMQALAAATESQQSAAQPDARDLSDDDDDDNIKSENELKDDANQPEPMDVDDDPAASPTSAAQDSTSASKPERSAKPSQKQRQQQRGQGANPQLDEAKPGTAAENDDGEGAVEDERGWGEVVTAPDQQDADDEGDDLEAQLFTDQPVVDPEQIAEMRAALEDELMRWRNDPELAQRGQEFWQRLESLTAPLSQELCEQLRLVMAPSLATKLKGDYRTGKRLNMKKIIPYIASQFKKDKIWLRRTKPSKREYQVLLSIDDSKSMDDKHSAEMAFEALAVISKALTKLEIGELGVLKFSDKVTLLHPFDAPFTDTAGADIIHQFTFKGEGSNFRRLMETSVELLAQAKRSTSMGGSSGSAVECNQLQFIISDGVLSQDKQLVRKLVRQAAEANILLVFIIMDANANQDHSILMRETPEFQVGGGVRMVSYMDSFPFPYYVALRDINALPTILSDALRQWFELINMRNSS
ncbi:midasin [Capsaspora owczarzaki ATCC 30864]|uniref:Midasin n=1 Tax=Capsaspora owczarzaki (strain ATCC 30864) TaxID=595528 RepID=A0A0D2WKA3_CAPO3|nr:midasin [Capsaspora owczarzaki ATCC 30864]KJE89993.1 midasin [Capsaspora owczarzaki ATCC 30864]|eukprot:XP_004349902.1 midasin [Capsaspora owczarzaki ATCC 30864]